MARKKKQAGVVTADLSQRDKQKSKKDPKKNRRKHKQDSFSIYIYKVLKQVHPQIGISKKAMNIMNSFIHDTLDRIAIEGAKLTRFTKTKTLSSREM
jgi:histone H2B